MRCLIYVFCAWRKYIETDKKGKILVCAYVLWGEKNREKPSKSLRRDFSSAENPRKGNPLSFTFF